MSKQFWAVVAVVVLALIGVFIVTGHKSDNTASGSSGQPTSHIEGGGSTGVTLVEYGDYECPYCEEYAPIVAQVYQDYSSKITFQFRNFPLTSLHPNAFAGARAAEAAGLEGKFWQMHDALYASQDWQQWSTSSNPNPYFATYASEIGLDPTTFQKDFASTKVNDLVTADMAAGNKLGIDATPTFFVNGKQVQVGASVADFHTVIDAAIKSKAGNAASSTTTSSGTTSQTTK